MHRRNSFPRPTAIPDARNSRAGSFVIPVAQPYGAFAKTLLERQNYRMPTGKELRTPYDVTGHTLGLLLGLEVYQADEPFSLPLAPLSRKASAENEVEGVR